MENSKDMPSSFEYELKNNDILYFLHIPKTAGTSLIAILESYFDLDSIYPEKLWQKLLKKIPRDFTKYKLVRGHFAHNIHQILHKKPVYITMLRDPVERTISQYEHIQHDPIGNNWMSKNFLSQKEMLEDLNNSPEKRDRFTNTQTRYIGLDCDVKKFTKNMNPKALDNFRFDQNLPLMQKDVSDDNLLRIAKKRIIEFEFVGLAERYQDSMFLLYYTFGWKPLHSSWKLNVSAKRPHRNDLPQKTIEIIESWNKLDTELYSYAKEIFEERYSRMVEDLKKNYYEQNFAGIPFEDMMYKMLEKHYEHRQNAVKTKLEKTIAYDFSQKLSGSGWYYREVLEKNNKAYRWTGPGKESTIDFPLANKKDLVILFHVFLAASPDILDSLKLTVNGQPIKLKVVFRKQSERYFEGKIPKSILSGKKSFTQFTFKINRTVNPHSINPEDPMDREVGLAFDSIKIMPTSEYDRGKEIVAIEQPAELFEKNKKLLVKLNRITKQNQKLITKLSNS